MTYSITRFVKTDGPLTKRITLTPDGKVKSDGSACVMSRGVAHRMLLADVQQLADLIEQLPANEAIALGTLLRELPDTVEITTKRRLDELNGTTRPVIIARTGDYIAYQPGQVAFALLDFDTKGIPSAVAARLKHGGGFWQVLIGFLPALAGTARIMRRSTSAGLFRQDTGEKLLSSDGVHVFVAVKNGLDVDRFLRTLHDRCWLAGFGWMTVGAGGQLLERSIVDRMVGAPERLVFEGTPVLEPPLAQDAVNRRPVAMDGTVLDTIVACPPLTILEQSRLRELRAREEHQLASDSFKAREAFITEQAKRLADRNGLTCEQAERVVARQCSGVLLPDVPLQFDHDDLAGTTVKDVLADPARFDGATLADPLEGIEYGSCKAKIMRRVDGTPWIHSFAHGRTVYTLQFDARAIAITMASAPADQAADRFVRLALNADLDEQEVDALLNQVAASAGIGKRALTGKLKQARQERDASEAQTAQQRRIAERRDPRPQIPAPAADAPWLPQMAVLNDVLGASPGPEPPARDVDGAVVQVRVRRVPNMHALTAAGSNEGGPEESRLPAPEQPMLMRLSEDQLAELIEQHIDYRDPPGRSVHLAAPFVRHFRTRADDALPIAAAIATLPIVLADGTLLAKPGLDRDRGIVFRIPNELLAVLPNREDCTPTAIAEAMRYLTDVWLCDVATDYAGKGILIAIALTIIERSLLPDRPAFWVTAGRRGGGKTTTLIMLLMAVTGLRPAAAAWSSNEEERRKALLAYLLAALPVIIWDNITRGAQISCPHIEASCTTALYSDRRLGVSEMVAVAASVIHLFTGNNIGPRGDLASRSLQVRLEVDRADPENREFTHPDSIGWTEANRGHILQALYTILLGNPALWPGSNVVPETRFKTWWWLIGSAVEYAAKQHDDHVAGMVMEAHQFCKPESISFKSLFIQQEEDEEESASLADALAKLREKWPGEAKFTAAEVANMANSQSEFAPDDERQRHATVREFLFPDTPPFQTVTAKSVGKRLKRHIGEPIQQDGLTMILKEGREPADGPKGALKYFVKVTKAQP